jgi:hypothetical protein
MPAPVLVKSILDQSAALLNDVALTTFTYAFQLPYFKTAYNELEELLEQNNIAVSNETVADLVINIGQVDIGGPTGPALPLDLIEIQQMFEKTDGTSENFMPMNRVDFLPNLNVATQALIYWQFNDQFVKFLEVGATSIRRIKINYVAANLPTIIDENTNVPVFNAKTFLAYRTAALCANYIGENEGRATYLNGEAQLAIDRLLSINVKAYQSMPVRRRPFRQSWKLRGWW